MQGLVVLICPCCLGSKLNLNHEVTHRVNLLVKFIEATDYKRTSSTNFISATCVGPARARGRVYI